MFIFVCRWFSGTFACMTLATGGWLSNLIVYLIKEYNINSIDATLISNIVSGCLCVFPVVGAVLADSFFGSFFVILISTSISLLVIYSSYYFSLISMFKLFHLIKFFFIIISLFTLLFFKIIIWFCTNLIKTYPFHH